MARVTGPSERSAGGMLPGTFHCHLISFSRSARHSCCSFLASGTRNHLPCSCSKDPSRFCHAWRTLADVTNSVRAFGCFCLRSPQRKGVWTCSTTRQLAPTSSKQYMRSSSLSSSARSRVPVAAYAKSMMHVARTLPAAACSQKFHQPNAFMFLSTSSSTSTTAHPGASVHATSSNASATSDMYRLCSSSFGPQPGPPENEWGKVASPASRASAMCGLSSSRLSLPAASNDE
mmetsp:Transcript_52080/g.118814  ORF Transcript_52080/g.118814 Transcript_52080/m.118814 type:complete len:232 (-) Transcript_52080:135-830(-)